VTLGSIFLLIAVFAVIWYVVEELYNKLDDIL